MTRRYAQGTKVSVESSRAEIERSIRKYGAQEFGYGEMGNVAFIAFKSHKLLVRFTVTVPSKEEFKFDKSSRLRSLDAMIAERDAEYRRRWRALLLIIKAKFESVESGINVFEQEFFANIVLPGGRTVYESAIGEVQRSIACNEAPRALLGDSAERNGSVNSRNV